MFCYTGNEVNKDQIMSFKCNMLHHFLKSANEKATARGLYILLLYYIYICYTTGKLVTEIQKLPYKHSLFTSVFNRGSIDRIAAIQGVR